MRQPWLAALLVVVACGCSGREARLDDLHASATHDLRRGAVAEAAEQVNAAKSLIRNPASEWAWKFGLLEAELTLLGRDQGSATNAVAQLERLPSDPPSPALLARRRYLEAHAHVLLGHLAEALTLLETAERDAKADAAGGDVWLDICALRGQIFLRKGQREQGEAVLQDVLERAAARGDQYRQAVALHNLARGRMLRNRFDEALAFLERLLQLTDVGDYTVYVSALNHAGICYARLGQFDQAVSVQQRAIERHEKAGVPLYLEQALGELGNTYMLQERPDLAIPYLSRAYEVAHRANLTAEAALWAENLAEAAADLGDFDRAERFNHEANRLNALVKGPNVYFLLNAGQIALGRGRTAEAIAHYQKALEEHAADPLVRWEAHAGLAKARLRAGDRRAAAAHFEQALNSIHQVRSGLRKTEYRVTFLARVIRFYQDYVDMLMTLGDARRALEVADASRAVVLGERMQTTGENAARDAGSFVTAAKRTAGIWLSYWIAPERSYVWVVSGAGVRSATLPGAREIERLVREYQSIVQGSVDPLAVPGNAGDRLYAALVAPIARFIPSNASIRIVPDGPLHGINFETLPVDGERRHYWIEDATIAVAPSFGLLAGNTSTAAHKELDRLLIVGDPTPREPEFPRLRYAPVEMEAVARHFPGGTVRYDGDRASPASYFANDPGTFSVIHFTAHAEANHTSPLDSAVILAGPPGADKLYARDVAERPLHAELVTISACRSAGERAYSGEGLIGFSWAFLRAGARQVVAGLWDVDDQSTARLMDSLYAETARGKPVPDALRAAKLALMRAGGNVARPYYWGPFEVFTVTP